MKDIRSLSFMMITSLGEIIKTVTDRIVKTSHQQIAKLQFYGLDQY